jgi:translation initiation factor IF-2
MSETDPKRIEITAPIQVSEFAKLLDLSAADVVGALMRNGVMATINESIDYDTAAIIGGELGFEIAEAQAGRGETVEAVDESLLKPRPPVVAVMGHVDHGKTSLLDAIRSSKVAAGEAGGITQHIGAYQVERKDRIITFLDTPGHEAFSAIRAHGAKTADIAIIVVAADDGVKPQTKEAIEHAKAANVSIVVAINKIDASGADVNRAKQELSEIGVVADDWGGDIPTVGVSAKTGEGIENLLDVVLLVSDIAEPKARVEGMARGVVIESHLSTGQGPVASALIQEGTLDVGDWIVLEDGYGKVRSLQDFRGKRIKSATPATPVVISGLKELPNYGDWIEEVESERAAKDWATSQARKQSAKSLVNVKSLSSADLARAVAEGDRKELNIIVKADAQGSLESLQSALEQIGNDKVGVKIVSIGIGDITESDINAATASGAIIVGFHVSIAAAVNQLAKRADVEFRLYKIIYELLDDIRSWLLSLLPPEIVETEMARLKVLGVFGARKKVQTVGGQVVSGKITPELKVAVMRGKERAGEGKLQSLQRNKEVVKQVAEGDECGMQIESGTTIAMDDELMFYKTEEKPPTL